MQLVALLFDLSFLLPLGWCSLSLQLCSGRGTAALPVHGRALGWQGPSEISENQDIVIVILTKLLFQEFCLQP